MDWREQIVAHPTILTGKPAVRGTRLGVDFLLDLFAAGWSVDQVLANYPSLSPEAIQAVFEYEGERRRGFRSSREM